MKRAAKTISSAEMGENYLEHARSKFVEGDQYLEKSSWADAISSFQETIEFCVKASFLFAGLDYPPKHRISDREFAKLKKALPPKLEELALGKLFLISEFWVQIRLLAKYGSQALKVPPKEFFYDAEEATLAKKHSQQAFVIAFIIGKETGALEGKFPPPI